MQGKRIWPVKLSLCGLLLVGGFPRAQHTDVTVRDGNRGAARAASGGEISTTQQRVETETWWPTMSTAAPEAYAGSDGCLRCHADESSGEKPTSMQTAASRADHAALLQQVSAGGLERSTNDSYAPLVFRVHAKDGAVEYSVASGTQRESQQLEWVMGAGVLGQTFVYQHNDRWYQSRMSVYTKAPQLDLTTGLKVDPGADLTGALGQLMTPGELRRCFSCHTVHATTSRGFNPLHAEMGIGCEACHGPGAVHTKKMTGVAGSASGRETAIFNPAELSPSDSIDFCGACHRTFGDVTAASNQANDASMVRFQPYRLEKSRCWRETQDARLTCVACHNPHEPLSRKDEAYDRHCLSCHATDMGAKQAGNVCPTGAKSKCVSCHMPKVAVASMHGEFTDHFIRIVKGADGFAN